MNRAKIKKYLKKGDVTLIAKRAGVSQSMVSQYLAGRKNSDRIFEVAIALAEERKAQMLAKQNRIKAL